MNIGQFLHRTRKAKNFTQKDIAKLLNTSHQTISKWERGITQPNAEAVKLFIKTLEIDLESLDSLLKPESCTIKFYVCPICNSITWSFDDSNVICCGKRLVSLTPQNSNAEHYLHKEYTKSDYFVTSRHDMTNEHYISFAAYVSGKSVFIIKLSPGENPEFNLLPFHGGKLFFYCTKHGLFEQQ